MSLQFLSKFPSSYTPRPLQKEIINEIDLAINEKGFKKILICAPTGSGKSHIAVTIGKALKSSIIITAQKILQDQYVNDFPWIHPMKGKKNFPCLALYDSKEISYEDALKNKSLLCDKGTCSWEVHDHGKTHTEYCKFHPELTQFRKENSKTEQEKILGHKDACYYYEQKFKALIATHSVFNYSAFFQTKRFSYGFENYLKKDCLIVDEAHEIEDQIISFIGFEIKKSHLDEVKFKFSDYSLENNNQVLYLVESLGNAYHAKIKQIEEDDLENEKLVYLKSTLEKIDIIVSQLKENSENVVIDTKKTHDEITHISIKPLEISNYIQEFFDYPYQIYISATLNKKIFCKTMGFSEDDCYFIEIPKSPFLLENRRVVFENTTTLSNNPSLSQWQKIYEKIHEIMSKHSTEKGLILTSSKQQCSDIFTNLPEESAARLSVFHNDVNKTKEAILEEHKILDADVLLSPSLWFGVDLRDDLSRFQIIVKTPFPYLGEKRTRTKKEKNPLWYQYTTMVKILQGFGRSVRNKNDFAITYVLDRDAENLLKNMKEFVPQAYYDILGW